jgi:RHS repeat-associated protein
VTGTNWADPTYDAAGNMTAMPNAYSPANNLTLKYDAWNRLVEVKNVASLVQQNEFDGLGRRIVRSVYVSGSLDHRIHYYYNEAWQLLEERKEVSGTEDTDPLNQYVWHPYYIDALAIRWYDADTDANLAENLDGEYCSLHDANYNVVAMTGNTGSIAERYLYDPYGGVSVRYWNWAADSDNKSDVGQSHLFTGRELDLETYLQLNRNRFYASHFGRWLTRDPIDYWGGTNLYAYVGGMPTYFVDPLALQGTWSKEPGNSWHWMQGYPPVFYRGGVPDFNVHPAGKPYIWSEGGVEGRVWIKLDNSPIDALDQAAYERELKRRRAADRSAANAEMARLYGDKWRGQPTGYAWHHADRFGGMQLVRQEAHGHHQHVGGFKQHIDHLKLHGKVKIRGKRVAGNAALTVLGIAFAIWGGEDLEGAIAGGEMLGDSNIHFPYTPPCPSEEWFRERQRQEDEIRRLNTQRIKDSWLSSVPK